MERTGYIVLLIVAVCWLIVVAAGLVKAFPLGLLGLLALGGVGLLFAKDFRDRMRNQEDDHYSKTVEK